MLFKLLNLNANLALTLGYLNPALNNLAQLLFTNKVGKNSRYFVGVFNTPANFFKIYKCDIFILRDCQDFS